jgi:hypothetical protein
VIWRNVEDQSASLDGDVELLAEPADAGPALGLHLVDVFHASEVAGEVGSSGFGGLLADGVGGPEVVDAGHLHGQGAGLGCGEAGQQGEQGSNKHGSHGRLIIDYAAISSFI